MNMEETVFLIGRALALALESAALLMVAIGGIRALVAIAGVATARELPGFRMRVIFIDFARWLVAALTFQLGSDIAGTTSASGWDEVAKLAAIALIRTFLTYFLDHDLEHARQEKQEQKERPVSATEDAPADMHQVHRP
jgi:uncharacterized membrane protein